ncbi:MAG: hypothetical protein A2X28_09390 [Elusimicrobia bacterium GWA2_56_46]|nr:MAG: hypothetical protein A2X28_09390 [Elusimicrobia bacterium GWA2_56_46]OGR55570.1 MAG: hypothetical protein A2X39_08580 [Elusimicrobia bacterium GWC2_56_31]HBB67454.1 hypothetical protein [Elusimicrobiota bacterium]HBW22024.1 hypothetical protein [Elusimicrobiota bacterium]
MGKNVTHYEGSEAAGGGSHRPFSRFLSEIPEEMFIIPALLFGLLFAFGSRWLAKKILPEIGSGNGALDRDFSSELGITDGRLSGMPVKYKWIPEARRKHPASLDIEFTVANPRNARLYVHKEGSFSRPLASLPPEITAPPLMDSRGFVLRLEPRDALTDDALNKLDEAMAPFCDAGLYEARLAGDKFFFSVIRGETYEIAEAKPLLARGAKAAALFEAPPDTGPERAGLEKI